jgi:hypothetical protein
MADTPFASELSNLVLQKRRREFEMATPALDNTLQQLYALPSAVVQREAFIADRPGGVSDGEWSRVQLQRRQVRLEG